MSFWPGFGGVCEGLYQRVLEWSERRSKQMSGFNDGSDMMSSFGMNIFKCGVCGRDDFASLQILEEHAKSFHDKPTWVMQGWICPRCGAGNSPTSSRCPCIPIKWEITC